MAHQNELARTAKIIDRGASAMLSSFLTLTGDAAVCFDATGTILLANEQALRMLAPAGNFSVQEELVGADVRQLLPPATASDPQAPFSVAELSVPTNGTAARLVRTSSNGTPYTLVVRCERVSAPFEAYLLVAHPEGAESTSMVEHERLVAELSRANRRLSGTLDIVLGTLDSPDVSTLFERVLEKLRETMDATGTMVYRRGRRVPPAGRQRLHERTEGAALSAEGRRAGLVAHAQREGPASAGFAPAKRRAAQGARPPARGPKRGDARDL